MSWPAMALGTGMNLLTGYLANQQMKIQTRVKSKKPKQDFRMTDVVDDNKIL